MLVYDRCISGQSSDLLFKIPSLASKWDNLQNDRVAMHRSPYLQGKRSSNSSEDLIHECYGSSDFKKEDEPSWGSGVLYGR